MCLVCSTKHLQARLSADRTSPMNPSWQFQSKYWKLNWFHFLKWNRRAQCLQKKLNWKLNWIESWISRNETEERSVRKKKRLLKFYWRQLLPAVNRKPFLMQCNVLYCTATQCISVCLDVVPKCGNVVPICWKVVPITTAM